MKNKELYEKIVLILESNNFEFSKSDGITHEYRYSVTEPTIEKVIVIIEEDSTIVLDWIGHYERYIDDNICENLLIELNKIIQ